MENIRNEEVVEETVEGEVFDDEVEESEPTKLEKAINFAKRNKSKIVAGLAIVAGAVIGYSVGSWKDSGNSDEYADLTVHVLTSDDDSSEDSNDSEEDSSEK